MQKLGASCVLPFLCCVGWLAVQPQQGRCFDYGGSQQPNCGVASQPSCGVNPPACSGGPTPVCHHGKCCCHCDKAREKAPARKERTPVLERFGAPPVAPVVTSIPVVTMLPMTGFLTTAVSRESAVVARPLSLEVASSREAAREDDCAARLRALETRVNTLDQRFTELFNRVDRSVNVLNDLSAKLSGTAGPTPAATKN